MFRITIHENPQSLTFQLEGRLAGTWVQELRDCWQNNLAARPAPSVRFDLHGVTYVDSSGRDLLATAHAQGVKLVASGCLMRAIVAELTCSGLCTNNPKPSFK